MDQIYSQKMNQLGYNQLVCDIFLNWEDVKDEILLPERKEGSGNGTIHVFLGAADAVLQQEFADYYKNVKDGEDPAIGAIKVKHYFMPSNAISMLGYVCQYNYNKHQLDASDISHLLESLQSAPKEKDMLTTYSYLKLSTGSSRLRPYFKQFESNGVFHNVIRQLLLPQSAYKISLFKNSNREYAAFWLIGFDSFTDFDADNNRKKLEKDSLPTEDTSQECSLQQIFYGAPGTGKSYTINQDTKGEDVVRTTFHPDSDYSTFVGAYKPTTKSVKLRDMAGHVVKDEETNKPVEEDRIVYEFVEQAFLKAYTKAWLNYAQAEGIGEPKKEYLVIEEINRGNCAQIFGDLFQLLDRNASGYSDYPIQADKDMQKQLQKAFKGVSIPQAERINAMYDGKDVVGQVLNGDILLLPNNLYIWATMNTSDQSLFPIDSAFKRRWDWTYVPISDAKKGYTIKVENSHYDWWQFLEKINNKIGGTTNSEDKKLGYFFCKADDKGEISAEKFVGKVIFYLWNDVFKDYEFGDAIFNDEDGTKLTFDKFHKAEGRKSVVMENKVQLFLTNLGLEPITSDPTDEEDEEGEEEMGANASIPKTAQIFNIEFPDGQKIEENNKFETYYQTLLKIGLEKVEAVAADMKYKRKGSPLVSRSEYSGILEAPQYRYVERDGFYIVKGIQDSTKYTFLDHLNKSLHLGLKITYK